MRFSTAICEGSKITKPAFGILYDDLDGACAIGAALLAVRGDKAGITAMAYWPYLEQRIRDGETTILNFVIQLNDDERLDRLLIAKAVEGIEDRLGIPRDIEPALVISGGLPRTVAPRLTPPQAHYHEPQPSAGSLRLGEANRSSIYEHSPL